MQRFLAKIAVAALGPGATAVDWAMVEILYGQRMIDLANYVERLSGESCSDSWLSRNLLYPMAPDAHARINRARRERRTVQGSRSPIDRDAIERAAAEWRAARAGRRDALADRPLTLADLLQPSR